MSCSYSSSEESFYPSEMEDEGEFETIFASAYRHKNGKLMIAKRYGLKAFPLRVRKKLQP